MFLPDYQTSPSFSSNPSMDDGSATAWIDNIIRDLINSSNDVSIPQLIHNVRDIIYPCNPSLATLLEFRLRSIIEPTPSPICPNTADEIRKEILPHQQSLGQGPVSGFNVSDRDLYLNWSVTNDHNNNHEHEDQPHRVQEPPLVPESNENITTNNISVLLPSIETKTQPAVTARHAKEKMIQQQKDEQGLHLVTLLLQCAEAVSADNFEEANKILLEISELSTPYGTSAQRVAAYFSHAMSARLVSSSLGNYAALPNSLVPRSHSQKMASAFQVFNGISPFVKFSHFTANQAIQEAFEREERVHIIDLDIMQGLQWPGLFHILASRPGGPPHVRLTGLGTSMEALEATGKRLSDFADKLGLPFEFIPVAERVGNLDREKLNVSRREAVAVHWLQHSLYDVTGSETNTLWLLQR